MLGLRGCSWWSLEADLSLKPLCPVMSPLKGLLAAWELHRMLSWCLPWHNPHTPWVSHWETLSSLCTICLSSDQVTPGGQKRGCRQRFQTLCLQPRGAGDSPGGSHQGLVLLSAALSPPGPWAQLGMNGDQGGSGAFPDLPADEGSTWGRAVGHGHVSSAAQTTFSPFLLL